MTATFNSSFCVIKNHPDLSRPLHATPIGPASRALRQYVAGRNPLAAEDAFLHGGVAERLGFDALAAAKLEHIGFRSGICSDSDLGQDHDDVAVSEKAL